jgi:hypothetical protein
MGLVLSPQVKVFTADMSSLDIGFAQVPLNLGGPDTKKLPAIQEAGYQSLTNRGSV